MPTELARYDFQTVSSQVHWRHSTDYFRIRCLVHLSCKTRGMSGKFSSHFEYVHESIAWPWCNLAASQSRPYCASVGLVSRQWDAVDWACVLCDRRTHNDRASRTSSSRQCACPFYSPRGGFLTCICLSSRLFRVTLEISLTECNIDVTPGTLTATDTFIGYHVTRFEASRKVILHTRYVCACVGAGGGRGRGT
jgi:hypothetical protein